MLLTGGLAKNAIFSSAEVYDPVTGHFTATGNMIAARAAHIAMRLGDGTVLVGGGSSDFTAEIYDPASGTFTQTGSLEAIRDFSAAVLLPDGRALMSGGSGLNSAELYK